MKDFISESYDSTVTFPAVSVPQFQNRKYGLRISGTPLREGQAAGIECYIASGSRIRLSIVDINGRPVALLASTIYQPGTSRIYWNGSGRNGERVAQGVYFVVLNTEWGTVATKLVVY